MRFRSRIILAGMMAGSMALAGCDSCCFCKDKSTRTDQGPVVTQQYQPSNQVNPNSQSTASGYQPRVNPSQDMNPVNGPSAPYTNTSAMPAAPVSPTQPMSSMQPMPQLQPAIVSQPAVIASTPMPSNPSPSMNSMTPTTPTTRMTTPTADPTMPAGNSVIPVSANLNQVPPSSAWHPAEPTQPAVNPTPVLEQSMKPADAGSPLSRTMNDAEPLPRPTVTSQAPEMLPSTTVEKMTVVSPLASPRTDSVHEASPPPSMGAARPELPAPPDTNGPSLAPPPPPG